MPLENKIAIEVEIIPPVLAWPFKSLVKLSDFAYGEWLIFKGNIPVFYLNLYHPQYEELEKKMQAEKLEMPEVIRRINKEQNESFSLNQQKLGIYNYGNSKRKQLEILKFPLAFFTKNTLR